MKHSPPVGLKGGCKRFIVRSIMESGGCGQVGFMVVTLDSHIYAFLCGKYNHQYIDFSSFLIATTIQ